MPIVEACVEASEFYANKVRVMYRGKDDNQMGFCNHFKAFLVNMQAYVKEYHTTGLTWFPRGVHACVYVIMCVCIYVCVCMYANT